MIWRLDMALPDGHYLGSYPFWTWSGAAMTAEIFYRTLQVQVDVRRSGSAIRLLR